MATGNVKKLAQQAPAVGTGADLFTVPANTKYILKEMLVCNPQTASGQVFIHHVPSGGAASTANVIVAGAAVEAGGTKIFGLSTVFEAGDKLVVRSVGQQLAYTVSGIVVV